MQKKWSITLAVAVLVTLSVAASGWAAGKFNKRLGIGDAAPTWGGVVGVDDQKHSLADYKDAKVIVQIFTCNHCPVAKAYENRLVQLQQDYLAKGVKLIAINCNNQEADKLPAMKQRAESAGFNFDYLYDPSQEAGRAYGAKVTPEVFVLDANRKIVYMGLIDDSWMDEGGVKKPHLRAALDAVLAGQTPEVQETKATGCGIVYE